MSVLSCTACTGHAQEGNGHGTPAGVGRFQAEILADGDVTDAELERALQAAVQCQRNHGLDAALESFDHATGEIVRTASISGKNQEGLQQVTEECDEEYLNAVGARYGELHAQTEEQLQAQQDAYLACLLARGFDVKGLSDEAIDAKVPPADVMACAP
jgi:hypothetical protein